VSQAVDSSYVVKLAEAYRLECVSTTPALRKRQELFDLILERTKHPTADKDIIDTQSEAEDRTLRRNIAALRVALEEIGKKQGLPFLLSIHEAGSGRPTDEVKLIRNTFYLKPNSDLVDFPLKKVWGPLFPNNPSRIKPTIKYLYTANSFGLEDRALTPVGDWQFVMRLFRAFSQHGINCLDQEALEAESPNEAQSHMILCGNSASNIAIREVRFPSTLPLRCDGKGRIGEEWVDERGEGVRNVYALVTMMRVPDNPDFHLWIFEASHDRALQAVGDYFVDSDKLASLVTALSLQPDEAFPKEVQLVFSMRVNAQNYVLGGSMKLVDHSPNPKKRPPLRVVPKPSESQRSAS
jgi:hypothetical protein